MLLILGWMRYALSADTLFVADTEEKLKRDLAQADRPVGASVPPLGLSNKATNDSEFPLSMTILRNTHILCSQRAAFYL